MEVSLPAKLRLAIYVVATVATPVLYYLNQQSVVADFWMGLYTVVVTAVTGLAALNTPVYKDKGE